MTRCQSCDGIVKKHEGICYRCGDVIPGHGKAGLSFLPLWVCAGLLVSAGFIAFTFLSGTRLY
jgi:hypothetical protein